MVWPFRNWGIGAWRERRRAFRELRRVVAEEVEENTLDGANPLRRAKALLEAGDSAAARSLLDQARVRFPAYTLKAPETIDVLIGLGDLAEAEAFALSGSRQFPHRPHYLEGYARVAECRYNYDEAVPRWAAVQTKFPLRVTGFVRGADCLRLLGRLDEADVLLDRILRESPSDVPALMERGRILDARGNWNAAYHHWISIRDCNQAGYVGAAHALRKLGRAAEAESLLVEARRRFPIAPEILILQAQIAAEDGKPNEAARLWATLRERFPLMGVGYIEATRLLRSQHEWAEADLVGEAAIARFPGDPWPLTEYALIARARQDWAEAANRWARLRATFPDREDGWWGGIEALTSAGLTEEADALRAEHRVRFARP